MPTAKSKKAKERRSFRLDDADEIFDDEDHQDEIRTRRSIHRVEEGPIFKTPGAPSKASAEENNEDFFQCLKLAAENKISSKNAFGLRMIDFLGEQICQKDSAISQNFALASCSLDAGTKIYAARVDCVAKNFTDFAMVMTMANKKGNGDGYGRDDEDLENEADTLQAKKKKIRRMRRHAIFAKTIKELQVDYSKIPQTESVFPIVGNLMHEAVDSFFFVERNSNGTIEDLMPCKLESSEDDKPLKIKLANIAPEATLCPMLSKFVLEFELSDGANDMLNSSSVSLSNSLISLREFEESPLENNDSQADVHNPFDSLTVDEEQVGQFASHNAEHTPCLVADRTSSTISGPLAPKKWYHDGRLIQLQGPAFWKWKRPTFASLANKFPAPKRTGPKHVPLDFENFSVDMVKLAKKRTKVTLQRDTLVKWSAEKITLPFEVFEGEADGNGLDVGKYSILPMESIPNTTPMAPAEGEPQIENGATDEFFNDQLFPVENEIAHRDDDDSDDDGNIAAVDDDDIDSYNLDLENLFKNSVLGNTTRNSFMTNIGFDESNLIAEPVIVETILPEWKPARRFNMKKLESTLWENIEIEKDGIKISTQPHLHELYDALPSKLQKSASITTVLYALLNVANRKCLAVNLNEKLDDCQVEHLRRMSLAESVHPAIL